ncbi:porin [Paraburkholderia sp. J67]|uniref:porin n=1 Tax=Paraburkholderia sp. J67 TaxID=2805435 RepID=UPI002ABDBC68|nr:porin [Paraburkholderia sp. J67]
MASGAASAQSSVTLYGVVDGSILYTSKTMNSKTGADAGHQVSFTGGGMTATLFGLRGAEDLGAGTRAIFDLESGVNLATGAFGHSNGNMFGRQAWVGIEGPYGKMAAGLQFSPFFLSIYDLDPRGMSNFGSGLLPYVDNVLVTGLFNNNAISYTSPEIMGLQAAGMFSFGGTAGDFSAGRQYSASLRYHLGALTISGALYSGNAGGTGVSTPIPSTAEFVGRDIGASYHFSNDFSIYAAYTLYKVAGSFDNAVYSGGFSYFVTPYLNVNAGVYYTRDGNESSNHSILAASGVQFFLSKRTTLYGQVGYVNNHGRMDTGLSINNALYGVKGATMGVSIGIRQMF